MKISNAIFCYEALSDQQRRVYSKKSLRLREADFSFRSHCGRGRDRRWRIFLRPFMKSLASVALSVAVLLRGNKGKVAVWRS